MKETLTIRHNPEQPKHMDVVFEVWKQHSPYARGKLPTLKGMKSAYALEISAIKDAWYSDSVRLIVPVNELRVALLETGLTKLTGRIKFHEEVSGG